MKSRIKKICAYFMLCVMILAVCSRVNKVSAYELTETDEGKVLKLSTAELYEACVKNTKCDRLIVVGKIAKSVFWFIEDLECEVLDLSDLEIDVIPHESFIENHKLRKVILPKKLKKVEFCCFSGCYFLETVVLPEGLRGIGHGSFMDCPKLKMEVSSNIRCEENVFNRSPGVTILDSEPMCGCCLWLWQWLSDFKEKTF